MNNKPVELLQQLFTKAWQSASADYCLKDHLASIDHSSIILLALGKSATQMAVVAQQHFGERIRTGLAVTAYGHSVDKALQELLESKSIETLEAAHPVPDKNSQYAATRLLDLAQSANANNLVLVLLSGGGSSLASLPINELTLEQKQTINTQLLKSGATIEQINTLRKHLSRIKGGRLSITAQPAMVHTLAMSDVPVNSPHSIASGPTLPDDSTCSDCLQIIERYSINVPDKIIGMLRDNLLKIPGHYNTAFNNGTFEIVASPQQSLDLVADYAKQVNLEVINLGADWYQDADDIAAFHCQQINNAKAGTIILSGGEASVRVTGTGSGGRNGQFLLSLACRLEHNPTQNKKVWAISCDTDGIDGGGDNAGCMLTPDSIDRAREVGLDPHAMRVDNNSYAFFSVLDDLVITGPTGTNVNDFRAILIL